MIICPTCGARNPDNAVFCDECGASLKSPNMQTVIQSPANPVRPAPSAVPINNAKNCPVCGTPTLTGGLFCENCGASLAAHIPQPSVSAGNLPPTVVIPGAQSPVIAASVHVTASTPTPAPASVPNTSPTCAKCGAILELDSAFCDMCGAPVSATSQTINPGVSAPDQPEFPESAPEAKAGFEPTWVGGNAVPQSALPPQLNDAGTQQQFAPTQIGDFSAPQTLDATQGTVVENQQPLSQSPTVSYGVQQSYGQMQVGSRAPVSVQAWLAIPGANVSLKLSPGKHEFIVGREDPINNIFPDIDLTDYGGDEGGVSRQHARITLQGSQYYLADLQSTNSTYINQKRLQPNLPTLLHNGDRIRFGRTTLIFNQ